MPHKHTISVLIVDDSSFIRSIFTELLSRDAAINVVGTAADPLEAREKIKELQPDVLTLDIEMPKMDGIAFLERIMTLRPMPVVMASTLTQKGAQATIRCLEIGAVDYIAKPTHKHDAQAFKHLGNELIQKVKAAVQANIKPTSQRKIAQLAGTKQLSSSPYIIALGASTGGVEAIKAILTALPASTPPILITQHMPPNFTFSFAQRLDSLCAMRVHEAHHNQRIEHGNVYIAPGSAHLRIKKSGQGYACTVKGTEKTSGHCPSVDVLFESFAEHIHTPSIGIILTGMGKDGALGLKHMRNSGAFTIGQNAESCVVYGMPGAAQKAGAVTRELPLHRIAPILIEQCSQPS